MASQQEATLPPEARSAVLQIENLYTKLQSLATLVEAWDASLLAIRDVLAEVNYGRPRLERILPVGVWRLMRRCKEGFFTAINDALTLINIPSSSHEAPVLNKHQLDLLEEAVARLCKSVLPWNNAIARSSEELVRAGNWPGQVGHLMRIMASWLRNVEDRLLDIREGNERAMTETDFNRFWEEKAEEVERAIQEGKLMDGRDEDGGRYVVV